MPASASPEDPAGGERPRPRFADGSFVDWVRRVEERKSRGGSGTWCGDMASSMETFKECACTDQEAAARVVDFELSGRAAPSRERCNEDAVLRAMRSESAEPSFENFYNRGLPIDEPLPVPRYSLAELGGWESGRLTSLLRSGVPVVITDAYASLPDFFKYSWTCEDLERRFEGLPGYNSLEMLYRGDGLYEAGGQSFADIFRLLETGPLYWGPKSRPEEQVFLSPLLRNDEGVFGLPPDDVYRTSCVMSSTPEFWFQRPSAGARPHLDTHCGSTISIGLNGDKRWEIGPVDSPQRHPAFAPGWLKRVWGGFLEFVPVYYDGYYSSDDWRPVFETIVHEGEGLIFPAFMIHRTYAVRGPDGSTADNPSGDLRRSCTNSLTMQFDYPLPSAYLRAYWPRLSSVPDAQECIPAWHKALSLDPESLRNLTRTTCGSYVRSKSPRNTAMGRVDGGSLDAVGNATHLSIAGDLFEGWPEADLSVALDAAHALTSLVPIAGRRDAVVSKDDLRRMLARLNGASSKFSTDLQGFERRSALSTPVWTFFWGLCAFEYNLLRVFSYGGITPSSLSEVAGRQLTVGFHDLEKGIGVPRGSGMFCRCFYNVDKWTLSGRPVYLLLAAVYILVTIGVLGALAYALVAQMRMMRGGGLLSLFSAGRRKKLRESPKVPHPWSPS